MAKPTCPGVGPDDDCGLPLADVGTCWYCAFCDQEIPYTDTPKDTTE